MVLEMKIIKEELRFEENLKTSSAKELAKKNNVLLWDRNKLKIYLTFIKYLCIINIGNDKSTNVVLPR